MSAHAAPTGLPLQRRRTPVVVGADRPVAGLGRRLLAWATGRAPAIGGETRSPIDKPFPFFGE